MEFRVCDNPKSFFLGAEDFFQISFVGTAIDEWAVEKVRVYK